MTITWQKAQVAQILDHTYYALVYFHVYFLNEGVLGVQG